VTPYYDSVVAVEFVVFLPYNDTYVDEMLWIGAAVEIGGDRIWAGEMSVIVVNTSFSDMVSSTFYWLHLSPANKLTASTVSFILCGDQTNKIRMFSVLESRSLSRQ